MGVHNDSWGDWQLVTPLPDNSICNSSTMLIGPAVWGYFKFTCINGSNGDGHHCGPWAVGQVVGRRDMGAGCSVWGLCSEG